MNFLWAYKFLTFKEKVLTVQPDKQKHRTNRQTDITIARPPSSSSLKIIDRSFRYTSPSLWNNLPALFRQPRSSSVTTITPSITSSLFHSRLKTHLFHKSFPPYKILSYPPDCPLDFNPTAFADPYRSAFCYIFLSLSSFS